VYARVPPQAEALGVLDQVRAREAGVVTPQDLLLRPTCCFAAPAGGNDPLRRPRPWQRFPQ
jgi:hypothetical protein